MQTTQSDVSKSIEQLKSSPSHQQLGRKVCAASAWKEIEEPIGELWLLMAEIIREQCFNATDFNATVPESADQDHTIH